MSKELTREYLHDLREVIDKKDDGAALELIKQLQRSSIALLVDDLA